LQQEDGMNVVSIAEYRERRACGHLHDTTTRYDHARKLLTFLLVCPVCRTERVLETQRYEPRFAAHTGTEPLSLAA
jgi:hypothetical protein